MRNKTPEERKAIAAKGRATRSSNRELREYLRRTAYEEAAHMRNEIAKLEERLEALQRMETMNLVSASITNKALLSEKEIVLSALPWSHATGVYFLVCGAEVVYVGQAINVYARISEHARNGKVFDRYAFVPCVRDALNRVESLYIHCLRPRLNGNQTEVAKCAPIPLDVLIGMNPRQGAQT